MAGDKRLGDYDLSMATAQKKQKVLQDLHSYDPAACRQREWLSRDADTPTTSFRPVELHRMSAKHRLVVLDNQHKTSTAWDGLISVCRNDTWGN